METTEEKIVPLTAPFPWFGGKRRVAKLVWERFGNVPNYLEPFAGSLAVMLGNQRNSGKNENAKRERIWFSPHCLDPMRLGGGLFAGTE